MELVADATDRLVTGVALDSHNDVFAICASSGELLRLDKSRGELLPIMATEASPHGIAIDPRSGNVFLTDRSEVAILKLELAGGEDAIIRHLTSFEGRTFVAPTALAFAPDGELFFTDAGAEGDSSFADPVGAVYRTLMDHSQVVPLCARGIVRPSGIAIAPDGSVFVSEQGMNRVLRFVPRGTYYVGNVFVHLHGGMGPVSIAVSPRDGSVFVAQLDRPTANAEKDGMGGGVINVFGGDGELRGVIRTPSPLLSAIAIDGSGETLYAVEADEVAGSSKLYRFIIPVEPNL